MFKDHHYLSGDINKAARCYIGIWGNQVVAFGSAITMPSGTLKNAWRAHRTVILPDFHGMGIGTQFSDTIAQIHLEEGHRFFSRTAHPKLINHRENSPLWKPTSKHKKIRKDISETNTYKSHCYDGVRLCGSFEYIG
jgi:GNAT superfamily N-acetyltransferase